MTHKFWEPKLTDRDLLGKRLEVRMLEQVLDSGFLNDGRYTTLFEEELAKVLGCRHVVAVTSGTAALYLALKSLGIGPGDDVIVPDVTFVATANAVQMTGARVVLADVCHRTLALNSRSIAKYRTPATKAVIPVHLSGRPADVFDYCREEGLLVVEDAAEAFGSTLDGDRLGTLGHLGCFSFSPQKTITTGQGGAVATNDDDLVYKLRQLKDQGRGVRGTGGDDDHPVVGYNFKLTNLQAAVGLAQLTDLPNRLAQMKRLYGWYLAHLCEVRQVRLFNFGESSPQWVDAICERRDELYAHLLRHDIEPRLFWHPLHRLPPYKMDDAFFPVSTNLAPDCLWLPSELGLKEEDVAYICDRIKEFYR